MRERYYVISDCGSMDLHTVVEGLCGATGQEEVTLTPEFDKATHLLAIGKLKEHTQALVRFMDTPDIPLLVLDDRYGGVLSTTVREVLASIEARETGPEAGNPNGGGT